MDDKLFKLTIIDDSGKTWNDYFTTKLQTEIAALDYARRMFPNCVVVPVRFINKNRWFWFGTAIGFAMALALIFTFRYYQS
jgi:hypothetical protein